MQASRCTQGIGVVILVLLTGALVLDDMAMLLAGGTLVTGLCGQYLLFDTRRRAIIASIRVERTLSRNPVRKGNPVQVSTRLTFRGAPRIRVCITDLLPPNTVLSDGTHAISAPADGGDQGYSFRYRIAPVVHGSQPFGGLDVTVRNLFFSATLALTSPPYREPVLSTLPTGMFQTTTSESPEGARDNRKASVWSSLDVHSLREYTVGDDLRHVDWKVSAKHDKIFIRKYSSPKAHPPLVIVDLPWIGMPVPEKEFGRMISEVTGLVSQTLQSYQNQSILFISGPNVLHLIRDEKNPSRCLAELREWLHPAERVVHFYHMPDRSDLRSHVHHCDAAARMSSDPRIATFEETLRDRFRDILLYQRNPAFASHAARAVSQIQMTEAFLFTLGIGDTSHIRHIVRPLRNQGIRVEVRIIDTAREDRAARMRPARTAREVSS